MRYSLYYLSIYFFTICEFYPPDLKAQDSLTNHVELVLFNGHRISGHIFYNQNNKSVKIMPADSISIVVPVDIIRTIRYLPKNKMITKTDWRIHYFNITSFGFAVGNNPNSGNTTGSVTAEMVNGIAIIPALQFGIGIGYDVYDEVTAMPVTIVITGDLLKGNFTPFYFIEAGASKLWINDYQNPYRYANYTQADGKKIVNLGLGYRMYSGSRINLGFSIGYKVQDVALKADWGSGTLNTNLSYRKLGFKICLGF
jgi:hypothetical protein